MYLEYLSVEVRDKALQRLGVISPEYLDLHFSALHCDVGEWELNLPAEHPLATTLAKPGGGICISYRGEVILSGPMESAELTAASDGSETYKITGKCDHIHMADSLVFPDPTNPVTGQESDQWAPTPQSPFQVIREAVNLNMGPGALTNRRKVQTVDATETNPLSATTYTCRYATVLEVGMAMRERGAHWRLQMEPHPTVPKLRFGEYVPIDTQGRVRFDNRSYGGLESSGATISAPAVTRAIVAGEGHLKYRVTRQYNAGGTVEADWGRVIESFVDERGTVSEDALADAGSEVLKEGSKTQFTQNIELTEDSRYEFGVDYSLGSDVVVIDGGGETTTYVSGIACKVSSAGVQVGVVLGPLDKSESRIEQRISRLEKQTSGNTPWVDLALNGSWTHVPFAMPQYRVSASGQVVFRGSIKDGALGTALTLPQSIAPPVNEYRVVRSGAGIAHVTIEAGASRINVDSYISGGNNTLVSLAGLTYYIN